MKKKYIVKNSRDFEKIIKDGKCKKNISFIIHSKKNELEYDKYGISVSKKLGNAVFRNKYKRKNELSTFSTIFELTTIAKTINRPVENVKKIKFIIKIGKNKQKKLSFNWQNQNIIIIIM